ncbi:hypothetical protein ABEB36_009489 [Hypothenemus hampei]|uniref:G-protein coupled receptors family 1 profile domain-containing protein n=1 Tax=Hypothenemus hampei TaxID=57062 RepID=A0ABD1EGI5_HYPHA
MSIYMLDSRVTFEEESNILTNGPTKTGIIVYSVITPILCCCGIVANTVSLLVLKRKELVGSVYTYLSVLACVDLSNSIALMLGGISRGIMWRTRWIIYDSLIGLPVDGCLATLSILAVTLLTIENLASRAVAINLFNGDHLKANSQAMENLRQICTILSAIDVNTNFVFYYTFCPAFYKVLKSTCKRRKMRHSSNLQVNVFVVNGTKPSMNDQCFTNKIHKVLEISRKSIDSAIKLNLGNELENEDISLNYADNKNNYNPPFSTIFEESTTSSSSSDLNKYY